MRSLNIIFSILSLCLILLGCNRDRTKPLITLPPEELKEEFQSNPEAILESLQEKPTTITITQNN
jgi:PBP1b-binding outer membrane lipoprotein LpoB